MGESIIGRVMIERLLRVGILSMGAPRRTVRAGSASKRGASLGTYSCRR
jgi:hypothetical protein